MSSVIGFGTVGVTGSGMSFELNDDGSSSLEIWQASGARASLSLSPADTAALAGHLAPAPALEAAPAEFAPLQPKEPADSAPVNAAPAELEPAPEAEPAP